MCGNFGYPRSRYRELKLKKRQVLAWKVIKSLIIPKPLNAQSWSLETMWVLINASCKPSLGVPGHVTKILQAENGQKSGRVLNRYISAIIDIDEKWFVVFEYTTIQSTTFLLVRFVYPNLKTIFLVLHLFSYFFSFFFFCRYPLLTR